MFSAGGRLLPLVLRRRSRTRRARRSHRVPATALDIVELIRGTFAGANASNSWERKYDHIIRDCAPGDWTRCGAEFENC